MASKRAEEIIHARMSGVQIVASQHPAFTEADSARSPAVKTDSQQPSIAALRRKFLKSSVAADAVELPIGHPNSEIVKVQPEGAGSSTVDQVARAYGVVVSKDEDDIVGMQG